MEIKLVKGEMEGIEVSGRQGFDGLGLEREQMDPSLHTIEYRVQS